MKGCVTLVEHGCPLHHLCFERRLHLLRFPMKRQVAFGLILQSQPLQHRGHLLLRCGAGALGLCQVFEWELLPLLVEQADGICIPGQEGLEHAGGGTAGWNEPKNTVRSKLCASLGPIGQFTPLPLPDARTEGTR